MPDGRITEGMSDREALLTGWLFGCLAQASDPRVNPPFLQGVKPSVDPFGDYRPEITAIVGGKTLRISIRELVDHLEEDPDKRV